MHGDLITFVAEDDVWLAPADGGPRLAAVRRSGPGQPAPAVSRRHAGGLDREPATTPPRSTWSPADGGAGRQLTYWGDARTEACGWTPAGEVLAVTAAGQPFGHFTWAYAIGPERAGAEPVRRRRGCPTARSADLAVDAGRGGPADRR